MKMSVFSPNKRKDPTKLQNCTEYVANKGGLQLQTNYFLSLRALDTASNNKLVPPDVIYAFRDFVSARNKIAYDAGFNVDDATILSLISIGIELLKIIAAQRLKGPGLTISNMT
jgi:hypothetical protein